MHFDEHVEGTYRIYAGALESMCGDGYVAAVVVKSMNPDHAGREAYRDVSMSGGHRWSTPTEAMRYAIAKARELIRSEPHRLAC